MSLSPLSVHYEKGLGKNGVLDLTYRLPKKKKEKSPNLLKIEGFSLSKEKGCLAGLPYKLSNLRIV